MKGLVFLVFLVFLVYQVSAQEITLYGIEVTHENQWFFEDENIIEVRGLTLNNTPSDMDNVSIYFLNSSYAIGLPVRKNDSFYKIRVTLQNESIGKNLEFYITATDGPKIVNSTNHSIAISRKPSNLLPNFINKYVLTGGKHIKQYWFEYVVGLLLFLITIMVIQFIANSSHDRK